MVGSSLVTLILCPLKHTSPDAAVVLCMVHNGYQATTTNRNSRLLKITFLATWKILSVYQFFLWWSARWESHNILPTWNRTFNPVPQIIAQYIYKCCMQSTRHFILTLHTFVCSVVSSNWYTLQTYLLTKMVSANRLNPQLMHINLSYLPKVCTTSKDISIPALNFNCNFTLTYT